MTVKSFFLILFAAFVCACSGIILAGGIVGPTAHSMVLGLACFIVGVTAMCSVAAKDTYAARSTPLKFDELPDGEYHLQCVSDDSGIDGFLHVFMDLSPCKEGTYMAYLHGRLILGTRYVKASLNGSPVLMRGDRIVYKHYRVIPTDAGASPIDSAAR